MYEMTSRDVCINDLDLYPLFLRLLEKPGASRKALVMDDGIPAVLRDVADFLGMDDLPEVALPASIEEAESEYIRIFEVGMPAPPCPINEAPYIRSDPPTRIIHENLLFYRNFGLDLGSDNKELPDHVSNQLEFLSYLTRLNEITSNPETRLSAETGKRDFIERHVLSWIPKASERLKGLDERLYYPIFTLLESYLRADLDRK